MPYNESIAATKQKKEGTPLESRELKITFDENFRDAIGNNLDKEVCNAIGYLSTWAIHSESKYRTNIYGDKDGNISAVYFDKAGNVRFSIFGQRSETGTYSFHS